MIWTWTLDANHVGGDVSRTPPENEAGIKTYETYLATDAAGAGGALTGRMAAGTSVYVVTPDTDSIGLPHRVADTKSTLAEQTMPAALALTERLRCFLRRSGLGRELCG